MNVPPPSKALLDRVASMRPVRTRVPLRTLLFVAAASVTVAAGSLLLFPLRPDLRSTPRFALGALWLQGFLVPLGFALLPRRGQVVPDGRRAWIAGLGGALVLSAAELLLGGGTQAASVRASLTCAGIIGCLGASVFAIARLVLRKVLPLHAGMGAALGAAGGALGGLVLHLVCPYGGLVHTGLAHGGAVVLCALVGAALVRR